MTNKPNDGGPAFPIRAELPLHPDMPTGLTKREHFAGLAMQGLISREDSTAGSEEKIPELLIVISSFAVKMADALLAELAK